MDAKLYPLDAVVEMLGVDEAYVLHLVETQFVVPARPQVPLFDDEDMARVRLVLDLAERFEVNEAGMEIILNLLDQIHCLQGELKKYARGHD